MTLITGSRLPNTIHSRLHEELSWPRSLRKTPMADIHPGDARNLGLGEGDWVFLRTAAGEIKVQVHVTAAGMPGDVYMFHGYSEADANELIPAEHLDPYTGFPGFRQVRCRIQKAGAR